MSTPELASFIEESRAHGLNDDQIRQSLVDAGWQASDIDSGFTAASSIPMPAVPTNDASSAASSQAFYKKRWVWVSAIVLIVLLLAGGAAAYFLIPPKPEAVFTKMRLKMQALKIVKFQSSFTGNISAPNLMSVSMLAPYLNPGQQQVAQSVTSTARKVAGVMNSPLKFDLSGGIDLTNPQSPNFSISTSISYQNFSVNADALGLDQDLYLRLTQATTFGLLDVSKIKDTWIKVDKSEFTAQSPNEQDHFTDAQKQQLENLYLQHNPIKIIKQLPDDKINGQSTYAYDYTVDKDQLAALENGIYQLTYGHAADGGTSDYLKDISFTDGEMWIGKKDSYLYKVNGSVNINVGLTGSDQVSGQISWEINLSDFNQPLNLTAPANSESWADVSKALYGDAFAQANSAARDARRLADMRQMQTAFELYYNDNSTYPSSLSDPKLKTYVTTVPQAPTPPDGNCTAAENTYQYKRTNATNYTLTFCLGAASSGLTAGFHTATAAGIK